MMMIMGIVVITIMTIIMMMMVMGIIIIVIMTMMMIVKWKDAGLWFFVGGFFLQSTQCTTSHLHQAVLGGTVNHMQLSSGVVGKDNSAVNVVRRGNSAVSVDRRGD